MEAGLHIEHIGGFMHVVEGKIQQGETFLGGLVLGAIGVFVIDRRFKDAAAFTLAGAVLTFFGFMHGEAIGIAVTPSVTLAYLVVAAFLFGCAKYHAGEPIFDEEPVHGRYAVAPAE